MSGRLGPVSERQLTRALRRFDLGRLVSTEPVTDGYHGQKLYLTSTTGRYVLRGNPEFDWQLATERFYTGLLHRAGVPVPWPYLVDDRTDIFGWSYALMPRLSGRTLADGDPLAGLAPAEQHAVATALADVLALAHIVTWQHSGRYRPYADTVVPFDLASELSWPHDQPSRPASPDTAVDWRTRVVERTRHHLRAAAGRTTEADVTWADSIMDNASDALDQPFQPGLVLEDFKPGNVLVSPLPGTPHWRCTGLFDLRETYLGDSEADLARMLCCLVDHDAAVAATFLREYLARRPPRPRFAERFDAYLLQDRALLWHFYQLYALRYWPAEWTFRDWAGRYLDLARPLL
ncbi:MAG: phosphotransferase family protein [Micromonosporaceae bacterium]